MCWCVCTTVALFKSFCWAAHVCGSCIMQSCLFKGMQGLGLGSPLGVAAGGHMQWSTGSDVLLVIDSWLMS
jgi:hypothetical protein